MNSPDLLNIDEIRSLKKEMFEVQKFVVERFKTWFSDIEGKSFETINDAIEAINTIKYFIRLSELQILYKNRAVTLQVALSPRSTHATIQVRAHKKGKRENLYNGKSFPHLELKSVR